MPEHALVTCTIYENGTRYLFSYRPTLALAELVLRGAMIKAVILDLDHTLVVSKVDFLEMKVKIIDYLCSRGIPFAKETAGRPTYEITAAAEEHLKRNNRYDEIDQILDDVSQIMTEVELKSADKVSPIRGAEEALIQLKQRGIKIGILTRGSRSYATHVLASTRLGNYVDEIAARDDCSNPKPDPTQAFILMEKMGVTKKETLMVGDHPSDALCARNAGVFFVGVLTGSWSFELTKQLGSTIIDSVADLPDFIDSDPS